MQIEAEEGGGLAVTIANQHAVGLYRWMVTAHLPTPSLKFCTAIIASTLSGARIGEAPSLLGHSNAVGQASQHLRRFGDAEALVKLLRLSGRKARLTQPLDHTLA